MPQTAEQWFTQLCQEAGKNPEETAALLALAKHEKVGPKIGEVLKSAEDLAAAQGRAAAAQRDLEAVRGWYNGVADKPGAKAIFDRALAERDAAIAELETARGAVVPNPEKFITKDDLKAQVDLMANNYGAAIRDTARIVGRHVAKYGEDPDLDAIGNIATEKGISLTAAYDEYIKPREAEKVKKDREEWEKRTREEIERDVRSRHHLPTDPNPETSPFFSSVSNGKGLTPAELEQDLVNTWIEAGRSNK